MGSQPLGVPLQQACKMPLVATPAASAGNEKAKPQGAAELPQGGVGGPQQGGGAEEAEGATFRSEADHGQGPICQTLDVEQVDLQLKPWGKICRRQAQAKERVS